MPVHTWLRYGWLIVCCFSAVVCAWAQQPGSTYRNPVLHADYSDPDAIRVGNDYYMVASSFNQVPGLPLLHSTDLVHWNLIGYALPRLVPEEHYSSVRHGAGVWAPALRYRNGLFYIFYPDPDFGIYVITSRQIQGPWSKPHLLLPGRGLIDPCPLWDDDGKAYLVHAYAGSRAGIKSILVIREMDSNASKVLGEPVLVYDGNMVDPTVEGPKLYKRNGYYYIFAPAGGVKQGWQLALRSRNIYGPYERKVVLQQGNTVINGPHQGAWVQTPAGGDWFLHFQDQGAYGRIVHLQPMQWQNDWPVLGNGGLPVVQHPRPQVAAVSKVNPGQSVQPVNAFPLNWQWAANPAEGWAFPRADGSIRFYAVQQPDTLRSLWTVPNIFSQKFPAEQFSATAALEIHPHTTGERFGLIITGRDYAVLEVLHTDGGMVLRQMICRGADKGGTEQEQDRLPLVPGRCFLKVEIDTGAVCRFYFSNSGTDFVQVGQSFTARPGLWVGARLGLFALRTKVTNAAGFADLIQFVVKTR